MESQNLMLGFAVAAVALLIIAFGYWAHLKFVMQDILADEKRKLREWAYNEAEIRAQERVREILGELRVNIPVQLVNESNLYWGDSEDE